MPKKVRKNEIKKVLEKAGIYDPKLDSQIALTARQEKLLDKMYESLEKENLLDVEVSASGTEKTVLNPLIPVIMKMEAQLEDSYTALGLNFNAKSANIREAIVKDGGDDLASIRDKFE